MPKNFHIGDRVEFDISYPRKSSRRFPDARSGESQQMPTPRVSGITSGFVVGTRMAIMSDFVNHQPYSEATGTTEKVLLVAKDIESEPFIVRMADARKVEG